MEDEDERKVKTAEDNADQRKMDLIRDYRIFLEEDPDGTVDGVVESVIDIDEKLEGLHQRGALLLMSPSSLMNPNKRTRQDELATRYTSVYSDPPPPGAVGGKTKATTKSRSALTKGQQPQITPHRALDFGETTTNTSAVRSQPTLHRYMDAEPRSTQREQRCSVRGCKEQHEQACGRCGVSLCENHALLHSHVGEAREASPQRITRTRRRSGDGGDRRNA
jgi:hypothetical protein